jgi:esterase/lipase superfamily enzyme
MMLPAIAAFSDEITAGVAAGLITAYADSARVALYRRAGPMLVWYLVTAGDVRTKLTDAATDRTLRQLLDLDRSTPVETCQASAARPTEGPWPKLVLDGDRLVGIIETPGTNDAGATAETPEERAWGGRGEVGFRGNRDALARPAFEVIRVYYGTDRKAAAPVTSAPYYIGDRGELAFGTADVSIPTARPKGTLPRPSWRRFEFRENPTRHVMITGLSPLSRDQFLQDIRASFEHAAHKQALIFVHGYNVTFPDAVRRTAQLACDLRSEETLEFPGLPMLYSWPSQGEFAKYTADETNVRWSQPHFEQFLKMALAETGAERVHIIAHSMGNRAVIECLSTLAASSLPAGSAVLDQVVFAAPDYDAGTLEEIAQTLSTRASRCTLYASSEDLALKASRELRSGLRRAGESGDTLLVVNGIDTIDASNVDTSLLGHGYFGERVVLGDIFYLLKDRKGPNDRYGLQARRTLSDRGYWEFSQ